VSTISNVAAATTAGTSVPETRRVEQGVRGGGGRPLTRTLANLALVLVSLGFALLCAELLVRFVAPQQLILVRPDVWQPMNAVGWMFRPNLDTKVNWGEGTVGVFTDRDGFRVGRAGRVDAPPGGRVLLIGDSFMAALQVEYEQSLAGLLQRDLSRETGQPVAIRNAGQAGWDPPQYLAGARSFLARDTFALVIVAVYIGNDVVQTRPESIPPRTPVEIHRLRLPRRLTSAELVAAFVRPVNDFLETRSHLFIAVKNRLQTVRMHFALTDDYFPDEFRRSAASSTRWDVTSGMLADIATLAARHRTPTLFVLIPAPFQVERGVFNQFVRGFNVDSSEVDLDQPSRLVGERLRAHGLTVIDVLPAFRAADSSGGKLYGRVDRHLTPAGHELLARLVEPRVAELLKQ
jgi:hypothetical protein